MNEHRQHLDLFRCQTIFPGRHPSIDPIADDLTDPRQFAGIILGPRDIGHRPNFVGEVGGALRLEPRRLMRVAVVTTTSLALKQLPALFDLFRLPPRIPDNDKT